MSQVDETFPLSQMALLLVMLVVLTEVARLSKI
jgi:hypothetical protein